MDETIEILRASTEILTFLKINYNELAESYEYPSYPDHLINDIAGIDNAALYNSTSILDRSLRYDLYTLEILDILRYYPKALLAMCLYREPDEKTTIELLKEHKSYNYILHRYLEPFRTVLPL